MNYKLWTRKFWSDIGYWLWSWSYLIRRLVSYADISEAKTIIELGAWFWQVTEHIIAKKWANTRLIVVENDHNRFVELSQKYWDKCEIYEMSATLVGSIIETESIDIIISTLPLGSISALWVEHILTAAAGVLKKEGRFIQYQYALQNLKDVKKYFIVDNIYFEPRNIWPAFIYSAHKK